MRPSSLSPIGKGFEIFAELGGRTTRSHCIPDARGEYWAGACVATMSKGHRAKKIFIDYFRNGRGATSVAPYSSRARSGATIATPLSWNELTPRLKPETPSRLKPHVPKRLERDGDAWDGFFKIRQRITDDAIKKFQKEREGVLV